MINWCDHQQGIAPLNYVALMRYDTARRIWRDVPGTGELARLLIAAGAPVDGEPGSPETPLMTAASYGDAEVAEVLIEGGASLDLLSAQDAGGVPNATALRHAAVFGHTSVVDLLVRAGATIDGITTAAAAGDLADWPTSDTSLDDRIRALIMAADHQRLQVIDALLAARTPVDAEDARWGRQALRTAAGNGRPDTVRHLLARGADPNLRDPTHHRTALEWCRTQSANHADPTQHEQVITLLQSITTP